MRKKLYLLLLLIFSALRSVAVAPFTDIRELHSPIKPEAIEYSPLNGIVWWEAGIIRGLYVCGNEKDALIKLIHELFYLQPDGVTFDITTLNRKPAKYFSPSTIGKIIGVIRKHHITAQSTQADLQKATSELINEIAQDIAFTELVGSSEKKLAEHVKLLASFEQKMESLKKYNATLIDQQKEFKAKLLSVSKRLDNAEKKGEKNTIESLRKEKAIIDQQLKDLDTLLSNNKQTIKKIESGSEYKNIARTVHDELVTAVSLDKLAELIIASVKECQEENSIYIPAATQQVLLSFLWLRVNEKKDYLDYFAACPDILIDPSWLLSPEKINLWLAQKYGEPDLESFKADTKTLSQKKLADYLIQNYELTVFSAIAHKVWDPLLPPIISSIGESEFVKNDTVYKFANCAETALRNFINILQKKPKATVLDIELLVQTAHDNGFTLRPNLVEFYRKNDVMAALATRKVHNAFNQVVSDLGSDIVYLKPEQQGVCEIRATLSNSLRVLNYLLFNDDAEFKKMSKSEQLDELCKKISHPDFAVTWEAESETGAEGETEDVDVNTADSKIKIVFSIDTDEAFAWKFEEHHALISDLQASDTWEFAQIVPVLAETFNSAENNDLLRLNISTLFMQQNNYEKIQEDLSAFIEKNVSPSYLYILLNALYATNDDTKNKVVEALASINGTLNSMMLNQFIEKLLRSYSDLEYKQEALFIVVKHKLSYFYPAFKQLIAKVKKDPQEKGHDFISSYCERKLTDFADDANFIVEQIKPLPEKNYPEGPESDLAYNSILYHILDQHILIDQCEVLYPALEKKIKELNSKQLSALFQTIMRENVTKLHDCMKNNINALDPEELKTIGFNIILDTRVNFYDIFQQIFKKSDIEQKKHFLSNIVYKDVTGLHEWVKNILTTFNQEELIYMAHIIIYYKQSSFYDVLEQVISRLADEVTKKYYEGQYQELKK